MPPISQNCVRCQPGRQANPELRAGSTRYGQIFGFPMQKAVPLDPLFVDGRTMRVAPCGGMCVP